MKLLKKVTFFVAMMLLCIGATSMYVSAASESKDGVEVTLTTDKDSYSKGSEIKTNITIKNTNSFDISNVSLETSIPDGLEIKETSDSKTTIGILKAGEEYNCELVLHENTKSSTSGSDDKKDFEDDNKDQPSKGEDITTESQPSNNEETTEKQSSKTEATTANKYSEKTEASKGTDAKSGKKASGSGAAKTGDLSSPLKLLAGLVASAIIIMLLLFMKKNKIFMLFLGVIGTAFLIGNGTVTCKADTNIKQREVSVSKIVQVDNKEYKLGAKVSYEYQDDQSKEDEEDAEKIKLTIDQKDFTTEKKNVSLTGTYSGDIEKIVYNNVSENDKETKGEVSFSDNKWSLELDTLEKGINKIKITAIGINRNETSISIVVTSNQTAEIEDDIKLDDFTTDEQYFSIKKEYDISFTVKSSKKAENINLCDNQNVIGTMHDDGKKGDKEANDGIYTYVLTENKGTAGIFDYYAQAGEEKSEPATLYFFEEPTAESKEEIANVQKYLQKLMDNYEDETGYVPDNKKKALMKDVKEYLEKLLNNKTIFLYEIEGENAYIKFASGIALMFNIPTEEVQAGGSDISLEIGVYEPNPDIMNEELTNNAIDVSQKFDNITKYEHYSGEEVTLERIKKIKKNQIIIWNGHGGFGPIVKNYLATGEYFDLVSGLGNAGGYRDDYIKNRIVIQGTKYQKNLVCITSKFIDTYCEDLENDLILLLSCHSGQDEKLPNAFLGKGASAVFGFTDAVYKGYCEEMGERIISYMGEIDSSTSNYHTLLSAVNKSMGILGKNDIEYAKNHPSIFTNIKSTTAAPIIFGGNKAETYRIANVSIGSISGTILEEDKETPLTEVTVEVYNKDGKCLESKKTQEDGTFSFDLVEGTYKLCFSKSGYNEKEMSIQVEGNKITALLDPIIMTAKEIGIQGSVVDENGKAISGVNVEIKDSDTDEKVESTTTNENGQFSLKLENGEYKLVFTKEGYETVTEDKIIVFNDISKIKEITMKKESQETEEPEEPAFDLRGKTFSGTYSGRSCSLRFYEYTRYGGYDTCLEYNDGGDISYIYFNYDNSWNSDSNILIMNASFVQGYLRDMTPLRINAQWNGETLEFKITLINGANVCNGKFSLTASE